MIATLGALTVPSVAEGRGTPPLGAGTAGPPYDFQTELGVAAAG